MHWSDDLCVIVGKEVGGVVDVGIGVGQFFDSSVRHFVGECLSWARVAGYVLEEAVVPRDFSTLLTLSSSVHELVDCISKVVGGSWRLSQCGAWERGSVAACVT